MQVHAYLVKPNAVCELTINDDHLAIWQNGSFELAEDVDTRHPCRCLVLIQRVNKK